MTLQSAMRKKKQPETNPAPHNSIPRRKANLLIWFSSWMKKVDMRHIARVAVKSKQQHDQPVNMKMFDLGRQFDSDDEKTEICIKKRHVANPKREFIFPILYKALI